MAGSLLQNAYYVSNYINAILYGIELVLYFMLVRQLLELQKRTFMDNFMMMFSTVLLILNTIFWTTQVFFGQMMWINNPTYPGGIDGYMQDKSSIWYQTWGTTACVASNLMSDALLTYRCFVVWNSRRVIIFPSIIWVASLVFSIGLLYGSGRPNGDYFAGFAAMAVTAYTASTFAFNVIVTGLICGRIFYFKRYMRLHYGADTTVYTGAVAIVVESALPFTLFSCAYLVTYALGTDVAYAFSFYAMFTCLSPLMITLRVLSRRAWTREAITQFTTTISYHGPSHYVTTDGGIPIEFAEKGAAEATRDLKDSPALAGAPSPREVDISELPV
ncbi:hypothetical protein BD309DRAFT_1062282 [Dichomitus squalens]|uniref:Uncharacterized protein n=1 Tax=Dichomitus squalens (strain LYAD-421) TaxID=732165 RepID=R7SKS7_DICSQ|nr:uncharacterized protein DICSQDRAFT_112627 [Dichomitus squalens LYAD-421 SS1]EJF56724.1 hypothetical protein DICSQDRAFT_112627 [Dichomitus squalens LYAD-421 SS1]TBU37628.1 hypothetical protein BD309DRAFT_1062282 [Dichomitus squalens]